MSVTAISDDDDDGPLGNTSEIEKQWADDFIKKSTKKGIAARLLNEIDPKLKFDPKFTEFDSEFMPTFVPPPCIMCGEPLTNDDLLPYHIPHSGYAMNFPQLPQRGKDCTPSCMWCGKVFGSKKALEEHEDGCNGTH